MKVEQRLFKKAFGWENKRENNIDRSLCNIVFGFGDIDIIKDSSILRSLNADYPSAEILMCSTAGEIMDIQVNENSLSLVAIQFEKTNIQTASVQISDFENSFQAGYDLASRLPHENLNSVLLISDGHSVNGSELILAMNEFLPPGTIITGGMAGDGSRFQTTLVGLNEVPTEGRVAIVGFYGDYIHVRSGSVGGWDTFGVERLITRSDKNILYELDGKPALDVYKLYLGEYATELPLSGLFFPLAIRIAGSQFPLVRTILGINEENKSLTFAGNMPEGAYAQLMKANHDRLIDGAGSAAEESLAEDLKAPQLALLISCVGRKLVLGQRIEEEVEIVRSVFGESTILAGFYSYGEFAPAATATNSELHNQTMTITTISEV